MMRAWDLGAIPRSPIAAAKECRSSNVTSSIAMPQSTVDRNGRAAEISVPGRHDPVIVPRAVVVIECMCAFTLLDAMLVNMTSRADSIAAFYGR